jgi:hypothetical protein
MASSGPSRAYRLKAKEAPAEGINRIALDLKVRGELSDEEALATAIEQRQDELLEGALDLGTRLYAEKPKALLRRLSIYWESWRES